MIASPAATLIAAPALAEHRNEHGSGTELQPGTAAALKTDR